MHPKIICDDNNLIISPSTVANILHQISTKNFDIVSPSQKASASCGGEVVNDNNNQNYIKHQQIMFTHFMVNVS